MTPFSISGFVSASVIARVETISSSSDTARFSRPSQNGQGDVFAPQMGSVNHRIRIKNGLGAYSSGVMMLPWKDIITSGRLRECGRRETELYPGIFQFFCTEPRAIKQAIPGAL